MSDAEAVQVVASSANLLCQLTSSLFRDFPVTSVQVVMQIASSQVLEHDIDCIRVLEAVEQAYNVRMLAKLKNLDLTVLESHLF